MYAHFKYIIIRNGETISLVHALQAEQGACNLHKAKCISDI